MDYTEKEIGIIKQRSYDKGFIQGILCCGGIVILAALIIWMAQYN